MAASAGVFGDILLISFPSVNLANPFALTDSGDHQTFNVPVGSQAQRYWDDSASFTVQTSTNGGSTWTTAGAGTYTIRYVNGQVKLNAALTGTPGVQITAGKYFPYASMGNTTSWEAQASVKSVDATTHKGVGGSPFEDYALTTTGDKFMFKKWYIDETLINLLQARTRLIASCVDPVGGRLEAYGFFTDDAIHNAVAGLSEETLTFLTSGPTTVI